MPVTQEDRKVLRNIELKVERLEEGHKAINQRIDDIKDNVKELLYVVISGVIALIGFVLWDRWTALAPAVIKNKELEEREERIERALKELARQDPKVAEVLKQVGLL